MHLEQWLNDTDKGKQNYWEKMLSQCHFVHHKSHTETQSHTPRFEAGDWLHKAWHGISPHVDMDTKRYCSHPGRDTVWFGRQGNHEYDTSGSVTLGEGNFLTKWATDSFLWRVPYLWWHHCLVHHYYAAGQNSNDLDSVGTYPKLLAKLAHTFRQKQKSVSLSTGRGVQSIKSQKTNLCTPLTRHNRK